MPRGPLRAGASYRIRIAGSYTDNGTRMGNFNPAGPVAGRFNQTITVRTGGGASGGLPLHAGADQVSAMTISRLAVPMPAFLPSVNQIGFDSYDWIASTISRTRSRVLMWVIGAYKDASGVERVDPHSAFSFPLDGRYAGRSVILSSTNVPLEFSFGVVPLRRFEMRGDLGPDLRFRPGASLYAETVCATVPNYGAQLAFTGICNPGGVLAASGTFLSNAYGGSANVRPPGLRVGSVRLVAPTAGSAGSVEAKLIGPILVSAASHVAAILLTDAATGAPVSVDYRGQTATLLDARGRIVGARLRLGAGTRLPQHLRAYVIVDAFPVGSRVL